MMGQKELFEFEKPKRSFPKLSDLLPKGDFENRVAITLTLERIVLIAIVLVMLMVVVFAYGIEVGKNRTRKTASAESRISLVKAPQIAAPVKPAAGQIAAAEAKPFVIYAASFMRSDYAAQEMKKLRKAGMDAYLTQGNGYYRLCIGAYATKNSAMNDLSKVQRLYKGAYIKGK